MIKTNR